MKKWETDCQKVVIKDIFWYLNLVTKLLLGYQAALAGSAAGWATSLPTRSDNRAPLPTQ